MTRLVVWRHGRTAWNAESRVQGHADVDLDEVGRAEAARSAVRVARLGPDLVISSDLRRATSTAQALAELTGLPVELDARLRERYFGPWQGLTGPEIAARFPDDHARWTDEGIANPEIETVQAFTQRVVAAFRDVIDRVGAGTAVLVTHGGAARVGCGCLLGWPQALWRTLGGLVNCHWSELVHSPDRGWQLRTHNAG